MNETEDEIVRDPVDNNIARQVIPVKAYLLGMGECIAHWGAENHLDLGGTNILHPAQVSLA